jgi:hypothetical protein
LRPRMLDLTAPRSKDGYEVHLNVRSKIGALHEITGFLAEANVDILSMHIQATRGRTADIVAVIEMEGSRTSIGKLIEAVKELDYVQEASAVKKDRVVFEEFLFPLMMDEEVRGFLMTESAWMSIATRLVLTYGTGGLAILHEAGTACGEEYAKQLRARLGPGASAETGVENLTAMLRAAGLGLTEVSKTADGLAVRVREPIIRATETKIHDHFLTGVIAGAAGRLFATSFSVENVRFEGNELGFVLGRPRAAGLAQVPPVSRPAGSTS